MNAEAERTEAPAQAGARAVPADSVLAASVDLVKSLRRSGAALLALLAAEARLLKSSVAVIVIGAVALVVFSVALWACAEILLGWALTRATGSLGIALGILLVLHAALVVATWYGIKRAIHHASFPETRAEVGALRHSLQRDLAKFQRASTAAQHEETSP